MPTYMTLLWPVGKLTFKTNPVGIRKFIRIPYFYHFPYFSGTMLELELEIQNDSEEKQDIHYQATLFRLSGITDQRADHIKQTEGDLAIKAKEKIKKKFHLTHLPQPGNYSVRLDLDARGKTSLNIWGDAVYFDALPKDATSFSAGIVIIASIISLIIGLIVGSWGNG